MAACEFQAGRRPPEPLECASKFSWSHPNLASVVGGGTGEDVVDANRNISKSGLKQTLPRPLRPKRHSALGACRNVNLLAADALNANLAPGEPALRGRSSFHQDVHEALSSLLWQPYEYRSGADGRRSPPSSCGSSGSVNSAGLGDANKGPCAADPNPGTDVVNNLRPPQHQCQRMARSREALSCTGTSGLSGSPSRTASLEPRAGAGSACQSDCDVYGWKDGGDMQIELPPSGGGGATGSATGGALSRAGAVTVLHHQPDGPARATLGAINVVGLPRRASVPQGAATPQHPRNASEPAMLPAQHRPNAAPPRPDCTSAPAAHLRSASAPRAMGGGAPARPEPLKGGNVSNVNVNFYRAVPVNVVSPPASAAVPTIQCLNTLNSDGGNSVSNVHIMPLGQAHHPYGITGTTQVTVHSSTAHANHNTQVAVHPPARGPADAAVRARTFTSTEAQTDEISVCPPPPVSEARRRERRERRHPRRTNNHRHTVDSSTQSPNDRLPDLLSNHLPPPYSPLPSANVPMVPNQVMVPHGTVLQTVVPNSVVPFPPPPPQVPLVQGAAPVTVSVPPPPSGFRFPFPAGGFRRNRFSEDPPKGCCGLLAWKPGSLRWFIAVIALVAVCCVLVGTALGAMRPAGRDHLTVSLLMIGVGIVLVTVSGVAWRLTSHDSSTCRSMLGLGSTESVDVCTRRFVPRLPPSYGRPHHPYAAMMYPEFQYRPPPPSYQASMQEYRLRLLLLDRASTPQIQAGLQSTVSPPPTYRSHAGSLLSLVNFRAPLTTRRDAAQSEYSCPPSYRSQTSTNHRPLHGGAPHPPILHSREQSLSLSESNNSGEHVVNVVNILAGAEEEMALDNITLDSLKMEPDNDLHPLRMLLKGGNGAGGGEFEAKDGNLVTIVQTNDQSPVIVTVSGSSQIEGSRTVQISNISDMAGDMEILAHL